MEQLVIILIAGLFALGKYIVQRAVGGESSSNNTTKSPSKPDTQLPPFPRGRTLNPSAPESEQERMRRFMDALGLPPGEQPPAQARRPAEGTRDRKVILQEQQGKVLPPPLAPAKKAEPKRRQIAPPSAPMSASVAVPHAESMATVAPQMEISSIPSMQFASAASYIQEPEKAQSAANQPPSRTKRRQAPVSLVEQLRNPNSLRTALIMREILGPPKALQ